MSIVPEVLNTLGDVDLAEAVRELKELNDTGVLCSPGVVRMLISRIEAQAGVSAEDAQTIVYSGIYRLAAFKWAGV